jgi:raffinose/stachyose/melibiose transport system permease protein
MMAESLPASRQVPRRRAWGARSRFTNGSSGTVVRWRTLGVRLLVVALMVLVGFVILYPVLMVIFTALKTDAELARNPLGVPHTWTFANFGSAWRDAGMSKLFLNSVIVSLGVVTGSVLLSAMGAFALARLEFPGKRVLPILLTIGLVLPFETLMIPIFYTFRAFHALNSYWAMILPQVGMALPFGILLIRGFIADLPQELFDAAEIDGAGLWRQFVSIVTPLARPALMALAVFQFLWSWNQYLVALVMVQDPALRTVPLGLTFFVGRHETFYTGLAAAAVIAMLPMFALYVVFHRQIQQANLAGVLK